MNTVIAILGCGARLLMVADQNTMAAATSPVVAATYRNVDFGGGHFNSTTESSVRQPESTIEMICDTCSNHHRLNISFLTP